jgi:hypothetical protein
MIIIGVDFSVRNPRIVSLLGRLVPHLYCDNDLPSMSIKCGNFRWWSGGLGCGLFGRSIDLGLRIQPLRLSCAKTARDQNQS